MRRSIVFLIMFGCSPRDLMQAFVRRRVSVSSEHVPLMIIFSRTKRQLWSSLEWSLEWSISIVQLLSSSLQPHKFSHPQQGRIDFNTVNPSLPTGMDFLIHPCRRIDDEENVHTPPKLRRYWEIHPLRP